MADFHYYNANINEERISDCVTRAISLGLGLKYTVVGNLLDLASEHTGYNRISIDSYGYLLTDVFCLPIFYPKRGQTVEDIIDEYPHNTLIIRLEGHLVTAIDACIWDLFDSNDREDITCYWIAK